VIDYDFSWLWVDVDELDIEVRARSPIVANYDLAVDPSLIPEYLRTKIDVGVEVVRVSDGAVVYSDVEQVEPLFSGVRGVSFSANLADGDYSLEVSTSLGNEGKCLDYESDLESFTFAMGCSTVDADADGYDSCVDCDDGDAGVWQILSGYVDSDDDGYGVGPSMNVCSGVGLPFGYSDIDGDCDDSDGNVNPGVNEVCGDGIDNDCDGEIDEGCNSVPSVVAAGVPSSGIFPLLVSFSCQGTGGDGTLEYFWDFGNGDLIASQNPGYTYLVAGDFDASCRVRDEDGDEAYAFVGIEVGMQGLDIAQVVCFDEVIEGGKKEHAEEN